MSISSKISVVRQRVTRFLQPGANSFGPQLALPGGGNLPSSRLPKNILFSKASGSTGTGQHSADFVRQSLLSACTSLFNGNPTIACSTLDTIENLGRQGYDTTVNVAMRLSIALRVANATRENGPAKFIKQARGIAVSYNMFDTDTTKILKDQNTKGTDTEKALLIKESKALLSEVAVAIDRLDGGSGIASQLLELTWENIQQAFIDEQAKQEKAQTTKAPASATTGPITKKPKGMSKKAWKEFQAEQTRQEAQKALELTPALVERDLKEASVENRELLIEIASIYSTIEDPASEQARPQLEKLHRAAHELFFGQGQFLMEDGLGNSLAAALEKAFEFFSQDLESETQETTAKEENALRALDFALMLQSMTMESSKYAKLLLQTYGTAVRIFPENEKMPHIIESLVFALGGLSPVEVFLETAEEAMSLVGQGLFPKQAAELMYKTYFEKLAITVAELKETEPELAREAQIKLRQAARACRLPINELEYAFGNELMLLEVPLDARNLRTFDPLVQHAKEIGESLIENKFLPHFLAAGNLAARDAMAQTPAATSLGLAYLRRLRSIFPEGIVAGVTGADLTLAVQFSKGHTIALDILLALHKGFNDFISEGYRDRNRIVETLNRFESEFREIAQRVNGSGKVYELQAKKKKKKKTGKNGAEQAVEFLLRGLRGEDMQSLTAFFAKAGLQEISPHAIKAARGLKEQTLLYTSSSFYNRFAIIVSYLYALKLKKTETQGLRFGHYFTSQVINEMTWAKGQKSLMHNYFVYKSILFFNEIDRLAAQRNWGNGNNPSVARSIVSEMITATNAIPSNQFISTLGNFTRDMLRDFVAFAKYEDAKKQTKGFKPGKEPAQPQKSKLETLKDLGISEAMLSIVK